MKYRSKADCELCGKQDILLLNHLKNSHNIPGIDAYMNVLHERKLRKGRKGASAYNGKDEVVNGLFEELLEEITLEIAKESYEDPFSDEKPEGLHACLQRLIRKRKASELMEKEPRPGTSFAEEEENNVKKERSISGKGHGS